MNESSEILKILRPIIRGSGIIAVCILLAFLLGQRSLLYSTAQFQSVAILRLDDKSGFTENNLYKDLDYFSSKKNIETEIETMKSFQILEKVAEKLDFQQMYYRKGLIKTKELYYDSPFLLVNLDTSPSLHNKKIQLHFTSPDTFELKIPEGGGFITQKGSWDDILKNPNFQWIIRKNQSFWAKQKAPNLKDTFFFEILSREQEIQLIKENLQITPQAEDIPILRIAYTSPVPEKAPMIVNTLCEVYIEDYILYKIGASQKTLTFLDQRIKDMGIQLQKAEANIESFRLKNGIVNTRQETETGLRRTAQLRTLLANLDMEMASLDSINKNVQSDTIRLETLSLNTNMTVGLLFTDLIKRLETYRAEKRELLTRYGPQHEEVQNIDQNISDILRYIKRSIAQNQKEIAIKRASIAKEVQEAERQFETLPSKERQLVILQRDFQLLQNSYNFLNEKRIEAEISRHATIAFHRILEEGKTPRKASSPNITLVLVVSIFLGLVTGLVIVYFRQFFYGKVEEISTIEKYSDQAVLATIPHMPKGEIEIRGLLNTLYQQGSLQKGNMVAVTSSGAKEGKSFISQKLCLQLNQLQQNVLFIRCNLDPKKKSAKGLWEYLQSPQSEIMANKKENISFMNLGNYPSEEQLFLHPNFKQRLASLAQKFDLIIVDFPPLKSDSLMTVFLQECQCILYLIRYNHTPISKLEDISYFKNKYQLKQLETVFNDQQSYRRSLIAKFKNSIAGFSKK
ncbi:exopolysaccharide transport family protein [Persicobacter sp. CCB-QB2]|uniref:exopolysaccharide transport family protein n=1 Tax=Persicobacter sp. CCB-QB2 TaxID=1561025 RepID=UPI0006A9AF03|nr:exopolysaccharide transport family protein [Persicobacter sp. CCB-QB2]